MISILKNLLGKYNFYLTARKLRVKDYIELDRSSNSSTNTKIMYRMSI